MTSPHDNIRTALQEIVAVLRPYSQSAGPFHDLDDVRSAIRLARMLIDRAEDAARKAGSQP